MSGSGYALSRSSSPAGSNRTVTASRLGSIEGAMLRHNPFGPVGRSDTATDLNNSLVGFGSAITQSDRGYRSPVSFSNRREPGENWSPPSSFVDQVAGRVRPLDPLYRSERRTWDPDFTPPLRLRQHTSRTLASERLGRDEFGGPSRHATAPVETRRPPSPRDSRIRELSPQRSSPERRGTSPLFLDDRGRARPRDIYDKTPRIQRSPSDTTPRRPRDTYTEIPRIQRTPSPGVRAQEVNYSRPGRASNPTTRIRPRDPYTEPLRRASPSPPRYSGPRNRSRATTPISRLARNIQILNGTAPERRYTEPRRASPRRSPPRGLSPRRASPPRVSSRRASPPGRYREPDRARTPRPTDSYRPTMDYSTFSSPLARLRAMEREMERNMTAELDTRREAESRFADLRSRSRSLGRAARTSLRRPSPVRSRSPWRRRASRSPIRRSSPPRRPSPRSGRSHRSRTWR